jgi:hypothetical protein
MLRDPECQRILLDFTDGEGRPLADKLSAWNVSAAEYLERLPFL